MITRRELEEYAGHKGLNLGNAEKDYLIDIALFSISRNSKNYLVFKGGTCLYKFHGLNRFSEDIDFTAAERFDYELLVKKMISDFERFRLNNSIHSKKEPHNSVLIKFRIEGPLYSGNPTSYASLNLDINFKSSIINKPELLSHSSVYSEIPSINLLCMDKEEMLAEKVRAVLTRNKARDLFDIHFLISNGVRIDPGLIEKKMEYYGEKFSFSEFKNKIVSYKPMWEKEMMGFSRNLEDFNKISLFVIDSVKKSL